MNLRKLTISLILVMSLISLTTTLRSAEIDGVVFKDKLPVSSYILPLRGYAVLNYMLVIKAYAGAFYIGSGIPADMALSETPKILELYYFHKISADDFKKSTIAMIKKNTKPDEYIRISADLEKFNSFYKNISPGDRYRAEYYPGSGITLYLNSKPLGTINNSEFAKAFFSIWIGSNPIDKKFRDILLGRT